MLQYQSRIHRRLCLANFFKSAVLTLWDFVLLFKYHNHLLNYFISFLLAMFLKPDTRFDILRGIELKKIKIFVIELITMFVIIGIYNLVDSVIKPQNLTYTNNANMPYAIILIILTLVMSIQVIVFFIPNCEEQSFRTIKAYSRRYWLYCHHTCTHGFIIFSSLLLSVWF